MSGDWPPCDQCGGIRIAGGDRCLAHVGADERGATLKRFSESGDLDVRGVTISEALFREIAAAAPHDADGHRTFSCGSVRRSNLRRRCRVRRGDLQGGRLVRQRDVQGLRRVQGATFKGARGARFADPDDPMFDPDKRCPGSPPGSAGRHSRARLVRWSDVRGRRRVRWSDLQEAPGSTG